MSRRRSACLLAPLRRAALRAALSLFPSGHAGREELTRPPRRPNAPQDLLHVRQRGPLIEQPRRVCVPEPVRRHRHAPLLTENIHRAPLQSLLHAPRAERVEVLSDQHLAGMPLRGRQPALRAEASQQVDERQCVFPGSDD